MLAAALLLAVAASAVPPAPRTLRLDYFHTGTASDERFALDALVLEGPWAGSPDHPLDDTNLGKYFFEVRDVKSGELLYSRGFASVYGEWESTAEAKERSRGFSESLRFPEPTAPVKVVLQRRGARNAFVEVWSVSVDPKDPGIDRSGPSATAKVWAVMKNGEPRDKVDLLLLGDGYTAAEMAKWHKDARRLTETLFAQPPFKERRSDFNVWALDTPSPESGVSRPSDGVYRRSALGTAYDAFGSERYVLDFDNKRLREAAADNAFTPYVFVHEFGHHFAGLADEYYTSAVSFEAGAERTEPWELNATVDPAGGKWKELIVPGTPLPTPWEKDSFEAQQKEIQARRVAIRAEKRPEAEMEALFLEERGRMTKLLASGPDAGKVGAFEGAMYEAKGYYRPQSDCIMFTRDEVGFCAVCRRAIERVIALYTPRR